MSMIIFDQSKQLLYTVKISSISSQSHHILLFYYHQYFSRIPVYSFLLPFLHKLIGFFLFSYHLLAVLTFNPRYYWRFFFVKLLHPFLCLFIQFIMLADPCGKIEKLVGQLFAENRYIEAIKTAENKYLIKPFGLEKLQPNNILQSYYLLQKRFYSRDKFNSLQNWHQNQLKIFVWLLVGYSFLQNRCISQMDESDWAYFCQIFKRRDSTMIQHQSKLLVKRKQKNVKWVSDEIEILRNLMSKNSKKNMWNSIARNLYIISGKKYLRSSKQCRQYWINHLDPTLKKESWSYEQDYKLIQLAYENNKKWSKVSKLFDGKRTQHMVKNRFNSLYNMEIKRNPVVNKNLPEQQVMSMLKTRLVMMIKEDSENANFVKTYANMDQIQENDCQKNQQLEVKKQMSKVSSQRSQEYIQEQQYQMQEYSISPLESNQKKESKESEKQMLQIREYEDQANNSRQYSFFGIAQKDVEFLFDK